MPRRADVSELENMMKYGRKKFVRYEEGAKLYSMGLHTFQELAKEANAENYNDNSRRRVRTYAENRKTKT